MALDCEISLTLQMQFYTLTYLNSFSISYTVLSDSYPDFSVPVSAFYYQCSQLYDEKLSMLGVHAASFAPPILLLPNIRFSGWISGYQMHKHYSIYLIKSSRMIKEKMWSEQNKGLCVSEQQYLLLTLWHLFLFLTMNAKILLHMVASSFSSIL